MKKEGLFEEVTFNDAAYAKTVIEESAEKIAKCKKGLYCGLATTGLWILYAILSSAFGDDSDIILSMALIAIVLAIVAYVIGGGFGTAIKWAVKIAKFGWFIMPFPIDIATGIMSFFVAIGCFFVVPCLFVWLNMRQINNEKAEAEKYLSFCA